MGATIKIELSDKIYLRDPEQTELGRGILLESIRLIDELGFEQFTFKKLASAINSTEASVYRYFENKHKLLLYLISWYWTWIDYQVDYQTNNVKNPRERLRIVMQIVTQYQDQLPEEKMALHGIVVAESCKAYLTKWVDADNREGLFRNYKALCHKIALLVQEINPDYPYAHALISTVIEAAHQQLFFAQHLPSLTEARVTSDNYLPIRTFLEDLVFKTIRR